MVNPHFVEISIYKVFQNFENFVKITSIYKVIYEEVSKKKVVTVHFEGFFVGYLQSVDVRTPRSDFLQLLGYTEPEKKSEVQTQF